MNAMENTERAALRRVALTARVVCAHAMASVDRFDLRAKAAIRDLYNALQDLDHCDQRAVESALSSLTPQGEASSTSQPSSTERTPSSRT